MAAKFSSQIFNWRRDLCAQFSVQTFIICKSAMFCWSLIIMQYVLLTVQTKLYVNQQAFPGSSCLLPHAKYVPTNTRFLQKQGALDGLLCLFRSFIGVVDIVQMCKAVAVGWGQNEWVLVQFSSCLRIQPLHSSETDTLFCDGRCVIFSHIFS